MNPLLTRLARAAGLALAQKSVPPTRITFYGEARPVWMPRESGAFAREGYRRNAIAHRAARLVAEAAAALPLTLSGAAEPHPLTALLARPNPREGGARFLEGVYGHLLVSGNAYLEAVVLEGRPGALYSLRPGRMRMIPGPDGWPVAYEYSAGGRVRRYDQDGALARILHLSASTRSTTMTGSRRWSRPRARSTSTTRRAPGTRRCSTTPPAPPARWSSRPPPARP